MIRLCSTVPRFQLVSNFQKNSSIPFDQSFSSHHSFLNSAIQNQNYATPHSAREGNWADNAVGKPAKQAYKPKVFWGKKPKPQTVAMPPVVEVKTFSNIIGIRAIDVLKLLILLGEKPRSIHHLIGGGIRDSVAAEFGASISQNISQADADAVYNVGEAAPPRIVSRAPVVGVFGHVDHGKTTLIDTIRKSSVANTELGGITQTIAAFQTKDPTTNTTITVLDTPGHEVFSQMRLNGVHAADLGLLLVSCDSGVQQQTMESYHFLKEAGIPIMVVITKIDKDEDFDPQDMYKELSYNSIQVDEWGGDIPVVSVSAETGTNIDLLLDTIVVQCDILSLTADANAFPKGVVLESSVDFRVGKEATIILQEGILRTGQSFVCGSSYGRVKLMRDWQGNVIQEAHPSQPVTILGFDKPPETGELLRVLPTNLKGVKNIGGLKKSIDETLDVHKEQFIRYEEQQKSLAHLKEQDLFRVDSTGLLEAIYFPEQEQENEEEQRIITEEKLVPFIIKADTTGSLEAIKKTLEDLPNKDEIVPQIWKASTGEVDVKDLRDVDLANLTLEETKHKGIKTPLFCFNTKKVSGNIRKQANSLGIEIKQYNLIYQLIDGIKEHCALFLPQTTELNILGTARIKQVFEISGAKRQEVIIAGCNVDSGAIKASSNVEVMRNSRKLWEGKIERLQFGKKKVKEIKAGSDCGIFLKGFVDFQEDDVIRAVHYKKVARKVGDGKQTEPKIKVVKKKFQKVTRASSGY